MVLLLIYLTIRQDLAYKGVKSYNQLGSVDIQRPGMTNKCYSLSSNNI
jgi:hypothetical protein